VPSSHLIDKERCDDSSRLMSDNPAQPGRAGFVVIPKRWVVERTFSWFGRNRRLSKDYERLIESSEAFVYITSIRLRTKRLAGSLMNFQTRSETGCHSRDARNLVMHQPDANSWIHVLHPLLNRTLAAVGELPVRDATALEQKDLVQAVYFHDGTERPIPRPVDPSAQKLYYSGKKKAHTVKNVVVSTLVGRILFLSPTCEGKKHDKKVADEADYYLPKDSIVYQDTGFQGFTLDEVTLCQPRKKPGAKT
jgi:hypothetical protein